MARFKDESDDNPARHAGCDGTHPDTCWPCALCSLVETVADTSDENLLRARYQLADAACQLTWMGRTEASALVKAVVQVLDVDTQERFAMEAGELMRETGP